MRSTFFLMALLCCWGIVIQDCAYSTQQKVDSPVCSSKLYYYCNVAVADMRQEPHNDSWVYSQTKYGDSVELLDVDVSGTWIHIKTLSDGYNGWVHAEHICSSAHRYCYRSKYSGYVLPHCTEEQNTAAVYSRGAQIVFDDGMVMWVPLGCKLRIRKSKCSDDEAYVRFSGPDGRRGRIKRCDVMRRVDFDFDVETMCLFSRKLVGIPYVIGGTSSMGFNCSGFVQFLYHFILGIRIPRISKEQAAWHGFEEIAPGDRLLPGDLIFWGRYNQGKQNLDDVWHVGMYLGLGDNEFVHATTGAGMPYIRVSRLTDRPWNGESEARFWRTVRRIKRN